MHGIGWRPAPLRSWTWLSSWWRHYRSPRTRLLVLGVFNHADFLVGAAPWFLDDAGPGRRVIRPLGSGEVCSDYVGILSRPDVEASVVEALADFLSPTQTNDPSLPAWDMLQLDGVDAEDRLVCGLVGRLAERGCATHRRPMPSCWRIELPRVGKRISPACPRAIESKFAAWSGSCSTRAARSCTRSSASRTCPRPPLC